MKKKPEVKIVYKVKVVDGGPKEIYTTDELAARWSMDPGSLENWRNQGKGPRFFKMGKGGPSLVRYAIEDIKSYESKMMRRSK